jgi:hypothetical protein
MSVRITHVAFEDIKNKTHEGITAYQYVENDAALWRRKANMVAYVEKGNRAFVGTGTNQSEALVVAATPKYLRTAADGYYNNNLLSLPTFDAS